MGRVAILGGTFDPVHWGHLVLAEAALSQLNLEKVIWVPVQQPPHKHCCDYEHRRFMVEIAIAEHSAFVIEERKRRQSEPDYAIDTLVELQSAYPNGQWFWLIGLDAFRTLPQWYGRERLIPACDWIVAPRALPDRVASAIVSTNASVQGEIDTQSRQLCEQVAKQLSSQNILIRWQLLPMPPIGISSSLIRQYCRQRRSIRYLVPERVQAYIATHNLYG